MQTRPAERLYFSSGPPLAIEHRDFSMRDDGAMIFSKEYLFARGTCCDSGCKNCPYSKASFSSRPVVSMVPSWTETLLSAGINVIGRTGYCVHPKDLVDKISVFGGTKTLSRDVESLMQEAISSARKNGQKLLVVLDREENPKSHFEFFEKYGCDIYVSHVDSLAGFERDLLGLSNCFGGGETEEGRAFLSLQKRFAKVLQVKSKKAHASSSYVERLILETEAPVLYVIWKNPWMVVRADTWIGSMLKMKFKDAKFPLNEKRIFAGQGLSKYPEISADEVPEDSILLFSSEPFPFGDSRKLQDLTKTELASKAQACALVDGEVFSWFGLRALRFLEENQ